MTLEDILDRVYKLPDTSKKNLEKIIREVRFIKGHILLRAGRAEHTIYFIKKGVVRAFAPMEEQDITFWFGQEGEPILPMKSYVEGRKSYESIELLSDCELYELKITTLNDLYHQDIHIANWGRKLAEKELLKLESRIVSTELLSAKERYDKLVTNSPGLFLHVPLKYIASYLGITPVSLSRIRKER